jgi:hypothetical protein
VTDDEHVVSFAEGNVAVRKIEGIPIGLGVNALPLKDIFRRDGVELRSENGVSKRIAASDLAFVDGGTDVKQSSIRTFERDGSFGDGQAAGKEKRSKDKRP